jgi:hypothetical protein
MKQWAEKYSELIDRKHTMLIMPAKYASVIRDVDGKTILDAACGPVNMPKY